MPREPVRFSVVIATLGRPDVLRETLESLSRCDPLPDELVVIDGDPERSAEPVVEEFRALGTVSARYEAAPRGASVQRNHGIDVARGDVLLFADDDVFFDRRLFSVLSDAYQDPDLVGATGRITQEWRDLGNERSLARRLITGRAAQGTMTDFGYPRRLQDFDRPHDVSFMQGCLMSVRRDVAARVRFDETLGRPTNYALLEDEDFSYRVSRLGRVRYLPQATVEHRNMGFGGRDARYFSWLVVVDRAYLFRKNFRPTPVTRLKFAGMIAVLAVHRLLNREWAGVLGVLEGSLEAWRDARTARAEAAGRSAPSGP